MCIQHLFFLCFCFSVIKNLYENLIPFLLVNLSTGLLGLFSFLVTFPFVFALNDVPSNWIIYEHLVMPTGNTLLILILVTLPEFGQ